MATYSYKGHDFEVDHEPTPEEFAQAAAYFDSLGPKETSGGGASEIPGAPRNTAPPEKDERSTFDKAKDAYLGLHELPLTLASGAAAGLAAIPAGAVNALRNGGTSVKDEADAFAQRNTYEPKTKFGQDALEKLGPVMEGMQALGPWDPFHAAAMVGKKPKMAFDFKDNASIEAAVLKAKKEAADAIKAAEREAASNKTGEGVINVDNSGTAAVNAFPEGKIAAEDPAVTAMAQQRAAELQAAAERERMAQDQLALGDESGQMALFDQGDQMGKRNQYNAGDLGDWRIDENGMPVRVDKSMEANNLEAPLQRNLWGDELGPALDQGRSLTQSIDDTPANGNWAQRKGMTNRLGGNAKELAPGNDLLAGMQEANGLLLPHEPTDMFQPRNPLPTERAGPWNPPEGPTGVPPEVPRVEVRGTSADGPAPGMVRMYHGGTGDAKGNVWFSREYQYAKDWGGKDRDNKVFYVDVPEGHPALGGDKEFGVLPPTNRELPADIASKMKPVDKPSVEVVKTDTGYAAMLDGKQVGKLDVTGAEYGMNPETARRIGEPASVDIVAVDPEHRGKGIGKALYDALDKDYDGNIRPSGKTTQDAWKVWKRDRPEKVDTFVNEEAARIAKGSNSEMVLANITDPDIRARVAEKATVIESAPSVTGASETLKPLPPEERPVPVDNITHPRSPEVIAEKRVQERAAENMPSGLQKNLDEFTGIRTVEEMKARIDEMPEGQRDIGRNYARGLNPGINYTASMTNHPLLKFGRTVIRDARTAAEAFSRKYLTAKDGIASVYKKMSTNERIDTMAALQYGDKHQFKIDEAYMATNGLSDASKAFIRKFYEANDALWARYNGNLVAAGMQPLHYREGHFPGIFKGAYKSLVMHDGKVVGVLAEDSRSGRSAAVKYMQEHNPEFTFVHQDRKGLGGIKGQSDMLSGMNDMIQLMSKHDEMFSDVQALLAEAIRNKNDNLFDFAKHKLNKKGVFGNEGNKPWLDAKTNAETGFKALIQYMEEAAMHHELFDPLNQLQKLAGDEKMQKEMPNALKEMDTYTKHVTGNSINPMGTAMNWLIDKPAQLIGLGPRTTIKVAQEVKHRMSQLFMGYGNYMFTAAQLVQPLQTGIPFMQLAANRLGMGTAQVAASMAKGGSMFMLADFEHMTGKQVHILPQHMREAHHYAMERGMRKFSELEEAYHATKSEFASKFDAVVDANMKIGEVMTRTPMFMSFVDMMHDQGIPKQAMYDIAENLTQMAMIDYHQFERPRMYSSLGVMGQFAGGLTTFKHGYAGMQAKLAAEAFGFNSVKKANPIPVAQSMAAVIALSGLTGTMFFDELDNIYGYVTDEFLGGRKTIRESFLSNLPEWVNSGALAAATNLGIQSKFSSANMVPDTAAKAASPQLEAAAQIALSAYDLYKNQDDEAARNLMMQIAPSTFKGEVEYRMARDPETGNVIGKDGKADIHRSEADWTKRRMTGMRPNTEVLEKQKLYDATKKLAGDAEKVDDGSELIKRRERNGQLSKPDVREKIREIGARGGPTPEAIIDRFGEAAKEAKTLKKQRLEGDIDKLDTPMSLHKFKEYNKPPQVNKPGER